MITAGMRAFMRSAQEQTMQHTCRIEPYVVAGDGTVSYGPGYETACGFNSQTGSHNAGSLYETAIADAQLRLPLGTYIGVKDRVTILTAYGEPIEPRTYEVSGMPDEGPTAILADLTEVYL